MVCSTGDGATYLGGLIAFKDGYQEYFVNLFSTLQKFFFCLFTLYVCVVRSNHFLQGLEDMIYLCKFNVTWRHRDRYIELLALFLSSPGILEAWAMQLNVTRFFVIWDHLTQTLYFCRRRIWRSIIIQGWETVGSARSIIPTLTTTQEVSQFF